MSDPPINLDELRTAASRGGRAIDGGAAFSVIRDNHLLALVEAVEAARDLYELVEMDESVGVCLSSRLPSLHLRDALARFVPPRAQEGDETP